jgi:hypothetical protein
MGIFISNAFSLSMLGANLPPTGRTVKVRPISLEEVKGMLQSVPFTSAVGHESTAQLLTDLLGTEIVPNRIAITLVPGDQLIVAQLLVRLPEGAVLTREEIQTLYAEGRISFYLVEVDQ